jgi:hypothetical protein
MSAISFSVGGLDRVSEELLESALAQKPIQLESTIEERSS